MVMQLKRNQRYVQMFRYICTKEQWVFEKNTAALGSEALNMSKQRGHRRYTENHGDLKAK